MSNNHQNLNIILTGFMGSGKSTVGMLVAKRLEMDFVDTDTVIEQLYGPIPEIFEKEGEESFREYEREISRQLAPKTDLVIATGGKLLLDPINIEALSQNGRIFCLSAPIDEIIERLLKEDRSKRPLLDSNDFEERIKEIYNHRQDAYATFEQVDTDGQSPSEIAIEITNRLLPEE
ncbi:MAG: shikimate kinase [Acidimicrobiales bacterium]|nr:shikimate kinase [Acidimicrobiales bacterium]